jgi:hypothetical protein
MTYSSVCLDAAAKEETTARRESVCADRAYNRRQMAAQTKTGRLMRSVAQAGSEIVIERLSNPRSVKPEAQLFLARV